MLKIKFLTLSLISILSDPLWAEPISAKITALQMDPRTKILNAANTQGTLKIDREEQSMELLLLPHRQVFKVPLEFSWVGDCEQIFYRGVQRVSPDHPIEITLIVADNSPPTQCKFKQDPPPKTELKLLLVDYQDLTNELHLFSGEQLKP